ncbi:formate dehydrogenase subunit delta [Methylomagnum ishizawai]|uniref:Formate dehydrogenase subunit delta n=1 Tax=Methylomagnum ishizawai TaxID=1760988 RepID=A0A1Y6D0W3_9GAMM|nr:formate dehydrogenase subunit delta [Methylomagnum ishizawai]SMF96251.1 formate dehydrogenase subunit delta [Methylomagnum ishizawai]
MEIENLVKMANDIGNFFSSEPDHETAVAGVYEHLRKFWDPRMRRAVIQHLGRGGEGLDPLAREAIAKLSAEA